MFRLLHELKKARKLNNHKKVTKLMHRLKDFGLCKAFVDILVKNIGE